MCTVIFYRDESDAMWTPNHNIKSLVLSEEYLMYMYIHVHGHV